MQNSTLLGHSRFSGEEIQHRAEALYEQTIRQAVETEENLGKTLAIDIETGAYEMDADEIAAVQRARAKHSDAALWTLRVGYNAMHSFGGGLTRTK